MTDGAHKVAGGLIDAIIAVTTGLDLERTLQTLVATAMKLVDARYGALGVRADASGNTLSQFIYQGIDKDRAEQIGPLPTGQGVLGLLFDTSEPVRIADISAHLSSVGFPPNHPPMRSFLGVPIRIRDRIYGNLYLTEKAGGGEFTAEDEVLVLALAGAAGIAIENARLYQAARTRQIWMEASREIGISLLEGDDATAVQEQIADRAVVLTACSYSAVLMAGEDPDGVLTVTAATRPELIGRSVLTGASAVGQAFDERMPMYVKDFGDLGDSKAEALVLPMRAPESVPGVLVCVAPDGFSDAADQMTVMAYFADQSGRVLELARSRADTVARLRQLDVLSDRDRIARDLHDHVIQRLFAIGLSLRGAAVADTSGRISGVLDDLQDVVAEIRTAIFDLHGGSVTRLRQRLEQAVAQMTANSGVRPTLRVSGPLSVVDPDLAEHAEAVVREAVSNVVRHAEAGHVTVHVAVDDDLTITVSDDGVGLPDDTTRSGLTNLAARADACGGTFQVGNRPTGGTRLVWTAPLP